MNNEELHFKKEMDELAESFLTYVEKDLSPGTREKFKETKEKDGVIITTFIESPDLNSYPVAMIFSYITGLVYFYISTQKPEGISELELYKVVNNLNVKYRVSNTSFFIGKNNTIVAKFMDLVADYSDLIYILQSLAVFADNELF